MPRKRQLKHVMCRLKYPHGPHIHGIRQDKYCKGR